MNLNSNNNNNNINLSLQFLYDFIQCSHNKKILIDNHLNPSCILNYYYFTKESYSKGKFYLGGQIHLDVDDIITMSHINQVKDIYKTRNEYDYANYWEYSSCMTHERSFKDFIDIFDFLQNKIK